MSHRLTSSTNGLRVITGRYCVDTLPQPITPVRIRRGCPSAAITSPPPAATAGDRSFEVVLQQSGTTLQVPPNKTLLAMLNEAGCDVMFDCERGECGVCAVEVIEGDIDHRDYVLTTEEKQAGKVIHVCVSRCHSDRLVLHL